MKKISSSIFYMKKVFPVHTNLFILIMLAIVLYEKGFEEMQGLFTILAVLIGTNLIYFKYVWGMVDEVYDRGDFLIVKSGKTNDRIYYADIIDVEFFSNQAPVRATLHLAKVSKFGNKVSFSPLTESWWFKSERNEVVEEIIGKAINAKTSKYAIK